MDHLGLPAIATLLLLLTTPRCPAALDTPPAPPPTQAVLILHDHQGASGWIGELHAILLANLLGHFDLPYLIKPIGSYQAGELQQYRALFYLGTTYDHPLPEAFLADAQTRDHPICWFKYNLWQLTASQPDQFANTFGFQFQSLDLTGRSEVLYRDEILHKDPRDPDLGRTVLLNTKLAQAPAWIRTAGTSNAIPYAVRSGQFWYWADSPFSYLDEEDRYLVFADLLHDILGIDHPPQHRALIRLEDISPDYPTNLLYRATDLLRDEGVPFAVNLIPVHADPLGVYGLPGADPILLGQRPGFLQAMRYMVQNGGQLILHGYTHQYRDQLNPYSGASSDDYEFFQVTLDEHGDEKLVGPVPEDSVSWVQERLEAARTQLSRNGLSPVAWATPHYLASPLDYRVFATNFPLTMQRVTYCDEAGHLASQFFPYPIARDVYGQAILPENLGYPISGNGLREQPRTVADLLRAAAKNRVVRDGWASAFFHPFLEVTYLRELVRGIRQLGFTFVPVTDADPPTVCRQSPDLNRLPGAHVTLEIEACGSPPLSYQWHRDGIPIPNANHPSLPLLDLQAEDFGAYTVQVLNPHGQTFSAPIHLRLLITPTIRHVAITNGVFQLWVESAQGLLYYVDYQDFLGRPAWTATFPVAGTGQLMPLMAPLGGLSQRFYRLRVE